MNTLAEEIKRIKEQLNESIEEKLKEYFESTGIDGNDKNNVFTRDLKNGNECFYHNDKLILMYKKVKNFDYETNNFKIYYEIHEIWKN